MARLFSIAPGVALLALLVAPAVARAEFTPAARPAVDSPHYGEALFYYYQQKYFSSATRLGASEHFSRLNPHDAEARLLMGGLFLSYGLHLEAGRLFEELIAEGAPPKVRDRAWFYVAKIRYQRGYLDEAEQALDKIEGSLPADLDSERRVLHAILLMERGRPREAVWRLDGINPTSEWAIYGSYNLGVALVRAGETENGVALLDKIGSTPRLDDEFRSLKDKANVALGYAFLQTGQPAQSRTYLERVRLEGMQSNKALLGMGWAYSAEENHARALVYWERLLKRDVLDSAVQEALIAVPYALGKAGVFSDSLGRYESAADVFGREMKRLDESIAAVRAGRLVEVLVRENPADEMGWFWFARNLPDSPETRYLSTMIAGHPFQEALKNFRDLGYLEANVGAWRKSLDAFDDMVANRRKAHAERLLRLRGWNPEGQVGRLRAEHEALSAQLQLIESERDWVSLGDAREREQWSRLAALRGNVTAADGSPDERIRRLQGVLTWNMAMQYHARVWEIRSALDQAGRTLSVANEQWARIGETPEKVVGALADFSTRIQAARERLPDLERRLKETRGAQAQQLAALATAELERQKQRLATYLTQARFSIAQIYDQASRPEAKP